MELSVGTITQTHSHDTETIVVVLEGASRFGLSRGIVTLEKDEVLHIPAHQEYWAEALADTVALKIATAPNHETQDMAHLHEDPDEYLWGV